MDPRATDNARQAIASTFVESMASYSLPESVNQNSLRLPKKAIVTSTVVRPPDSRVHRVGHDPGLADLSPGVNDFLVEETVSTTQFAGDFGASHFGPMSSLVYTADGRSFSSLRRGVQGPFLCPECPKTFKQKPQYMQHLRIHTGERPFKCTYCTQTFKQMSHRIQHERLHTGERPYQCTYCTQSFKQKNHLNSHLKKHADEGIDVTKS